MLEDPKTKLESADILKILSLLPHRYPFLLVDRIVDIDGDNSAIGIKNVSYNENIFAGHFPQAPVFPGVLLIEAMAQTAGAICIKSRLPDRPPSRVFFMTIDKAKFRKPVFPGDTVRLHMTKLNSRRNMWWYRGEAMVDGALAAEAEVSAMLVTE